jgi:hypothetical protein
LVAGLQGTDDKPAPVKIFLILSGAGFVGKLLALASLPGS